MIEAIAAFLFAVFLIIVDAFIDTMVVHTLYKWFIPAAFVAAPVLTMAQVAGISLTFRVLRGVKPAKDSMDGVEELLKYLLNRWAILLTCLIFGGIMKAMFF